MEIIVKLSVCFLINTIKITLRALFGKNIFV